MKIKRGDSVLVIAGDDKPGVDQEGKKRMVPRRVVEVRDHGKKVVVEGVNLVYKHVRRGHPKSTQGGRLRLEMPIQASNVLYYCDGCQKGSRLGVRYADDGSKERFCKRCGKSAGQLSPPRERYAKK